MNAYDPAKSPSPEDWLELDEMERVALVEAYHQSRGIAVPSLKAHALMHAIVENQLAESDEAVVRALARLVKQGLTRHDAIHAIAAVVSKYVFDSLNAKGDAATTQARYHAQVERLDAAQWWSGSL